MGVSIFTDDRSMCTFATDEEVSQFVCVHFTLLHEYPRMRCWCSVCIILLIQSCVHFMLVVYLCVGVYAQDVHCAGVLAVYSI